MMHSACRQIVFYNIQIIMVGLQRQESVNDDTILAPNKNRISRMCEMTTALTTISTYGLVFCQPFVLGIYCYFMHANYQSLLYNLFQFQRISGIYIHCLIFMINISIKLKSMDFYKQMNNVNEPTILINVDILMLDLLKTYMLFFSSDYDSMHNINLKVKKTKEQIQIGSIWLKCKVLLAYKNT